MTIASRPSTQDLPLACKRFRSRIKNVLIIAFIHLNSLPRKGKDKSINGRRKLYILKGKNSQDEGQGIECHNNQCVYERTISRKKSITVSPGLIMSQFLCIYAQEPVDARSNNS